jgi:hypothetical protein
VLNTQAPFSDQTATNAYIYGGNSGELFASCAPCYVKNGDGWVNGVSTLPVNMALTAPTWYVFTFEATANCELDALGNYYATIWDGRVANVVGLDYIPSDADRISWENWLLYYYSLP